MSIACGLAKTEEVSRSKFKRGRDYGPLVVKGVLFITIESSRILNRHPPAEAEANCYRNCQRSPVTPALTKQPPRIPARIILMHRLQPARQQLADEACLVRRQTLQHILQISVPVNPNNHGWADQTPQRCSAGLPAATRRIRPLRAPDCDRPDCLRSNG